MSDQQAPAPGIYVDYSILSPFGNLKNSGGPFVSKKEADDFVKELTEHHKQLLTSVKLRQVQ